MSVPWNFESFWLSLQWSQIMNATWESQVNTANIASLKENELRKKSLNTSTEIQQSLMLTARYWDNFKGLSIKKFIIINMISIIIKCYWLMFWWKYYDDKIRICPNCPTEALTGWDSLKPWFTWVSRMSQMSRLVLHPFNFPGNFPGTSPVNWLHQSYGACGQVFTFALLSKRQNVPRSPN